MTVSIDNIRDLLNRPRGLNANTVSEFITVRTNQVEKMARDDYYVATASAAVTTALKEGAIKMLVCLDCLIILVDTIATYYPPQEHKENDRRFRHQLEAFEKRADEALRLISEAQGSAYAEYNSASRLVG